MTECVGRSHSVRNSANLLLLSLFVLFGTACKKKPQEEAKYKGGVVSKSSKDFLIPDELVRKIEQDYLMYLRKEHPTVVEKDADLLARIPREFLDVKFYFKADAPGVLSSNVVFALPRGGGEFDLAPYVVGKKGSFSMLFEARRSDEGHAEASPLFVYFLSHGKHRKIDGEDFGSGCKVFADITRFFSSFNNGTGLKLNATDQRYVSVIGGVFYFVHFGAEKKIYLSAVRVTDSRYPELFCEEE